MPFYPSWEDTFRGKVWRTTHFPRIQEDMPTFLGVPHAVKTSDLQGADVVIIGAPFVAGWGKKYSGVDKDEWLAATRRVRQQSIRYRSGYIQEFDLDVFEHLKVVDYGDADIPPETSYEGTVEKILEAQRPPSPRSRMRWRSAPSRLSSARTRPVDPMRSASLSPIACKARSAW